MGVYVPGLWKQEGEGEGGGHPPPPPPRYGAKALGMLVTDGR